MEFYPLELIRDLIHAEGINFHRLDADLGDLSLFDCNLRKQLYKDYDYSDIRHQLQNKCPPNTLFFITDKFELKYIIFRDSALADDDKAAFVFLGPYLVKPASEILPRVTEQSKLHLFQISEMRDYYSGVPLVLEPNVFEAEVIVLVKYIFDTTQFDINRASLDLDQSDNQVEIQNEPNQNLSMSIIEERYRNVDIIMEAVTRGDYQSALLHLNAFRNYSVEIRVSDMLRNYKNLMIVLSSQLRRAVQNADVHPAHIHNLSDYFARKIEAARSIDELSRFRSEMIRKYCHLVQNHSLRHFSKNIQRVINHIDFHLDEPFILKNLAEIAGINSNYLSTCFKRETGLNLTDYINQKRMQKAIFLLNSTDLPIHIIAERIGILDVNYFSRLFKKIQGKSPSEYRKSLMGVSSVSE